MARIKFMNTSIDNLTMDEAIEAIDGLVKKKKNSYVFTPNVDHIVRIEEDAEFRKAYNNATLIFADGKPLIWISKLYKQPIKEKISGSDLFPKVCELASKKGYSVFLLGAKEGVADKAAENIKRLYNSINICGTYSPLFGFENNDKEIAKIIRLVNEKKPDILIVGVGTPKQEKFIYKYRNDLSVPVTFGFGAGIDFMAGNVKRAPKWVSNIGLEWFYRFLHEPKRLFKRYFVDDVRIILLVFKYLNK